MTEQHTKRRQRLALSYLSIIMILSIAFSVVIYGVTMTQLNRPLPPQRESFTVQPWMTSPDNDTMQNRFNERVSQTKDSLLVSLAVLNIGMLAAGGWVSYALAKRTLKPIEDAMDAQSQFISDASHELRTPLTALQTTIEVALRKKHIDNDKARQVLEKSGAEVNKLRDLAETLLTLAQIDAQTIKKDSVTIDELAADVVESMQDVAHLKNINLETSLEPAVVLGDKMALTQILTILIDNAIKYSPDSSSIHIFIQQTKHKATVSVQDHGVGIAEKEQKRIFERFYRADVARTRTATSGLGLGLAIAHSICVRQGYELTLVSTPGEGSTFSVAIPVAS